MKPQVCGDPVAALQAVLGAELVEAVQRLQRRRADVHGARKALKRARAVVRLLRNAIGDENYRQLNTALRDTARPLSRARDAQVLLSTLHAITADRPGLSRRVSRLRRALVIELNTQRHASVKHATAVRRRIERIERAFGQIAPRQSGWACVATSLKRTYKRGRRAYKIAQRDATTENLHEWRKQVQYLRHQAEALEHLAPKRVPKTIKPLHKLSDLLGEDHDLSVLNARVARRGPAFDAETFATLDELIQRRRRKLQSRAATLGARLFGDAPKQALRQFGLKQTGIFD